MRCKTNHGNEQFKLGGTLQPKIETAVFLCLGEQTVICKLYLDGGMQLMVSNAIIFIEAAAASQPICGEGNTEPVLFYESLLKGRL
jgi:hypothetical protein